MKKRIVSLFLALVMALSLIPTTVWAEVAEGSESSLGSVHVIVENTTYTDVQYDEMKGTLVDTDVTLTADAALLLANMKDAQLAPLEAAAEDVGVSPTGYYTTHTLCDAFLARCDQARMQSFAPLFEGSADAARAALAALLPNTFLQALVWHTLTAPEAELLPEVNQNEDL